MHEPNGDLKFASLQLRENKPANVCTIQIKDNLTQLRLSKAKHKAKLETKDSDFPIYPT